MDFRHFCVYFAFGINIYVVFSSPDDSSEVTDKVLSRKKRCNPFIDVGITGKGDFDCGDSEDPCENEPCKNGGTCTELGSQYTCTCTAEFKGSTCSIEVNPCDSDPCQNDGICSKIDFESYRCACSKLFTGENCEKGLVTYDAVLKFNALEITESMRNLNESSDEMKQLKDIILGLSQTSSSYVSNDIEITDIRDGSVIVDFVMKYIISENALQKVASKDGVLKLIEKIETNQMNELLVAIENKKVELNMTLTEIKSSSSCSPSNIISDDGAMIYWKKTLAGKISYSVSKCPSTGEPLATAECSESGEWTSIKQIACNYPDFEKSAILELLKEDEPLQKLEEITQTSLDTADTTAAQSVLEVYTASRTVFDEQETDQIMEISTNLLKSINVEETDNVEVETRVTDNIVKSIEEVINKIDLEDTNNYTYNEKGTTVQVFEIDDSFENIGLSIKASSNEEEYTIENIKSADADTDDSLVSIFLPHEVSEKAKLLADYLPSRLSMTVLDANLITSNKVVVEDTVELVEGKSISKLVSASFTNLEFTNLDQPVIIQYTPTEFSDRVYCGFWNSSGSIPYWSSKGCYIFNKKPEKVICYCYHLTSFALLVSTKSAETLGLSIVTYAGLAISIFGLSLTVATFIFFPKFRKGYSQKTLFQVSLSLLFLYLTFLGGIERTDNEIVCKTVAAFLYYFLLSSFILMFIEGILHYKKYVNVLNNYVENYALKTVTSAWGIPLIGIAIVGGYDDDLLWRNDERKLCFLSDQALLYGFIIPAALLCISNVVLYILMMKGIFFNNSDATAMRTTISKLKLLRLQVRLSVAAFVIFGLTWISALLLFVSYNIYLEYVFNILNTLQGLGIFLFYSMQNKSFRNKWLSIFSFGSKSKLGGFSSGFNSTTKTKQSTVKSNIANESMKK